MRLFTPLTLVALLLFCSCAKDTELTPIVEEETPEEVTEVSSEDEELYQKQVAYVHSLTRFVSDVSAIAFGSILQNPTLHSGFDGSETAESTLPNQCPSISPDPKTITEIPEEGVDFVLSVGHNCIVGNRKLPCLGDIGINLRGDVCEIEGSRLTVCPMDNFRYFIPESEINPFVDRGFVVVSPGCFLFTFKGRDDVGNLVYDTEISKPFEINDDAIFKTKIDVCSIEDGLLNISNTANDDTDNFATFLDDEFIMTFSGMAAGTFGECPNPDTQIHEGKIELNLLCNCPVGGYMDMSFYDLPIKVDFETNRNCTDDVRVSIGDAPLDMRDILNCGE